MGITAKDVTMCIGAKEILSRLNLSIKNQEFVGIIGPNGSGKSTFLKCVYRTLKPTGGAIFFDGRPIDEFSYRESAQKLSVAAQHNFYSFDFVVLDVVLMGRSPYKKMLDRDGPEDYEIARRALAAVGLAGFEELRHALRGRAAARHLGARPRAGDSVHDLRRADEPFGHQVSDGDHGHRKISASDGGGGHS